MRRSVTIFASLALSVAVGLGILWLVARGTLDAEVELAVEELAAEGIALGWEERSFNALPPNFEVVYTGVTLSLSDDGGTLHVPRLVGRPASGIENGIMLSFPPEMTWEAAEGPSLDIEAQGLTLVLSRNAAGMLLSEATAEDLLIVTAAGEEAPAPDTLSWAIEGKGFSGVASTPGEGGPTTFFATLAEVNARGLSNGENARLSIDVQSDGAQLSGSTTIFDRTALRQLLDRDAEGRVDLTYELAPTRLGIAVLRAADAEPDLSFTASIGASAGFAEALAGRIEIDASAKNGALELMTPDGATVPDGNAVIPFADIGLHVPTAPGDAFEPIRLRLALRDVELDDRVYNALDPERTLPRDPADLVFEVTGTGRLLSAPQGDVEPEIELGNVELLPSSLSVFGASVEGEGAVELVQPGNRAEGALTLRADGALELARQLVVLGVLPEAAVLGATAVGEAYARPGLRDGTLIAEVAFTPDGVTVNGRPLGPVGLPSTMQPTLPDLGAPLQPETGAEDAPQPSE